MEAPEAATPVSAEDARILAAESGPIRGHTLKLIVIDDAPGEAAVEALRAEIAPRLQGARRWRQRVVAAPATSTGFAWQDDPDFDVARHVRAVRAARPVDEAELRHIVAEIMKAPLDRARPLWTMDVVPRLADGRWAIVWKVHHGLADGVTVMRAGSRLLWTEPPSPPREARAPRPATHAASALWRRGLVLREFRRIRVWQLSPLAADVGPERVVGFARCSLDELRALGKAVAPEVTINDVLLSVIAGALRRWLQSQHVRRARMKVQVPVSMHPHFADDDPFGNRDSFFFLWLPLDEADPIARVRAVSAQTGRRKNRQDAQAIYALRDFLGRAPARVRDALRRTMQGPHEYSVNVSNVPGPAGPLHVLGRRVDELYSIAEIAPHHALRVAAVSLGGSLNIGLCADPNVVPDIDALTTGIRLSIDELRRSTSVGLFHE